MSKPASLRAEDVCPGLKENFSKTVSIKDLKCGDVIAPPPGWFSITPPYTNEDDAFILSDKTEDFEKMSVPGIKREKVLESLLAKVSLTDKHAKSLFGKECLVIEAPHEVSTPDTNMFSNCGNFYSWHTRIVPLDDKGAFSAAAKPIDISQGDGIYYHAIGTEPTRVLNPNGQPKRLTPTFG